MEINGPDVLKDREWSDDTLEMVREALSEPGLLDVRCGFDWYVDATGEGEYYTVECTGQLLGLTQHNDKWMVVTFIDEKLLFLREELPSELPPEDFMPEVDEEIRNWEWNTREEAMRLKAPIEWAPTLVEVPVSELGNFFIEGLSENDTP